jgi:hypothetical protein
MSESVQPCSEFMAIVEFQILPKWFELDTGTQKDYALQISYLLARYSTVKSRWFDADAWTSELSDFVICEFQDLDAYNELWSEMRRHPFLANPYARIGHVLMGMELDIAGLAQLAEPSDLEKPPNTSKPTKPKRQDPPQRPPSTSKPAKRESRETDDLSLTSCHFCGHQIRRTARFCSRCGTPAEAANVPTQNLELEKPQ